MTPDPGPLQVPDGREVRYSGTKVTAATLGVVAAIRLAAGLFEVELPIGDDELAALAGLLIAGVGYFLRRAVE